MKDPAHTIIQICGGYAAVAEMCDRDETRVRRWCYEKSKGGTGGLIPADSAQTLMRVAKERKIPLRPEHFFTSAPSQEGATE